MALRASGGDIQLITSVTLEDEEALEGGGERTSVGEMERGSAGSKRRMHPPPWRGRAADSPVPAAASLQQSAPQLSAPTPPVSSLERVSTEAGVPRVHTRSRLSQPVSVSASGRPHPQPATRNGSGARSVSGGGDRQGRGGTPLGGHGGSFNSMGSHPSHLAMVAGLGSPGTQDGRVSSECASASAGQWRGLGLDSSTSVGLAGSATTTTVSNHQLHLSSHITASGLLRAAQHSNSELLSDLGPPALAVLSEGGRGMLRAHQGAPGGTRRAATESQHPWPPQTQNRALDGDRPSLGARLNPLKLFNRAQKPSVKGRSVGGDTSIHGGGPRSCKSALVQPQVRGSGGSGTTVHVSSRSALPVLAKGTCPSPASSAGAPPPDLPEWQTVRRAGVVFFKTDVEVSRAGARCFGWPVDACGRMRVRPR